MNSAVVIFFRSEAPTTTSQPFPRRRFSYFACVDPFNVRLFYSYIYVIVVSYCHTAENAFHETQNRPTHLCLLYLRLTYKNIYAGEFKHQSMTGTAGPVLGPIHTAHEQRER